MGFEPAQGINLADLITWDDWLTIICGTLIVSAATHKAIDQEPKPAVQITQNVQAEANATQHIEPQVPPTAIHPRSARKQHPSLPRTTV